MPCTSCGIVVSSNNRTMNTEEIEKYRALAEKAPTEALLLEVAHHIQSAQLGREPLGSVRVSILLLEVVQQRLAREAASGN